MKNMLGSKKIPGGGGFQGIIMFARGGGGGGGVRGLDPPLYPRMDNSVCT